MTFKKTNLSYMIRYMHLKGNTPKDILKTIKNCIPKSRLPRLKVDLYFINNDELKNLNYQH